MTTKAQIRQQISEKRRLLDSQWIKAASAQIADTIRNLAPFQMAKSVALYKAIGGEVELEHLFPCCWEAGKRTCIPVFNETLNIYEMAEVTPSTPFKTGNYGIREPVEPALIAMDDIDLVVVPGVAFDPAGNRLGRGGGYYDRLLNGFSGVSVAVAFDFQLLPSIPRDPHDIPVGYIVTQTKAVKVQNER